MGAAFDSTRLWSIGTTFSGWARTWSNGWHQSCLKMLNFPRLLSSFVASWREIKTRCIRRLRGTSWNAFHEMSESIPSSLSTIQASWNRFICRSTRMKSIWGAVEPSEVVQKSSFLRMTQTYHNRQSWLRFRKRWWVREAPWWRIIESKRLLQLGRLSTSTKKKKMKRLAWERLSGGWTTKRKDPTLSASSSWENLTRGTRKKPCRRQWPKWIASRRSARASSRRCTISGTVSMLTKRSWHLMPSKLRWFMSLWPSRLKWRTSSLRFASARNSRPSLFGIWSRDSAS